MKQTQTAYGPYFRKGLVVFNGRREVERDVRYPKKSFTSFILERWEVGKYPFRITGLPLIGRYANQVPE